MGRTLAEKVWDEHVVRSAEGEPDLLYIDLHLLHEVTSPQAFEGLRLAGRIQSGTVSVNGGMCIAGDLPFGGYKASGIGREWGVEGIEEFLETKAIAYRS